MLLAYFKPTNFCNVGCSHCYLPESVRAAKDKMSLETVKKTAEFLAQAMEKQKEKDVFILWHGGEPLVLSPDFFWKAGEIFDDILPNHKEGIQTSLIPYTSKFKDVFLNRFNGEIGTSMDFASRQIKNSPEIYQDLWLKKVEMAKNDGMSIGVLMTPNKKDIHFAKERLDWFWKNKLAFVGFERYNEFGTKLPERPNNREHSQFLINVFDYIIDKIKKENVAPFVNVIVAGISGVLYDLPGDRWGGSCQSDFIVIEPDGSLNNCPDKAMFESSYSNLYDGFDAFANSPMRKKWIRLQQVGHRISDCVTCENNTWCKSGCPITPNADPHGDETECSGYKTFINHIRDFIKEPENKKILIKYINKEFLPIWSNELNDNMMMS